jgi:hypothetical protein
VVASASPGAHHYNIGEAPHGPGLLPLMLGILLGFGLFVIFEAWS